MSPNERINPLVRAQGGSRRHKQLRHSSARLAGRQVSGPGAGPPPAPSAGPRGLRASHGLPATEPLRVCSWAQASRWTAEPAAARVALGPCRSSAALWCRASLLPAPRDLQGTRLSRRPVPSGLPCTLPFLLAFTVRSKGRTLSPGPEGKGPTCHFRSSLLNRALSVHQPMMRSVSPETLADALWLRFAQVLGKRKTNWRVLINKSYFLI